MDPEILIKRNKKFALDVIALIKSLPRTMEVEIMGKQLLRSSTSFASNYRAACRSRSKAEFFSKISIVVEEIDECNFWLDLIMDSELASESKVKPLLEESLELTKIYSASRRTFKDKNQ